MSDLTTILAAASAFGALAAGYPSMVERGSRRRLPVGPDGIIQGAEPIVLGRGGRGVLILHGFGDTPQSVAMLAQSLKTRGYAVYAPLLAGHGRTLREFAKSDAEQWLTSARAALDELRAKCTSVSIVGQSLGGVLATLLTKESSDVRALVLLVPYFDVPRSVRRMMPLEPVLQAVMPYVVTSDDRSIHDPDARAHSLAFGATSPRLTAELIRCADRGRAALPSVRPPTLYVQAREDNRIAPAVAEHAFAMLGAQEKRIEWLDGTGHVIAADYQRARVAALAGEWLDAS